MLTVYILVYLLIGLILRLIGPIARDLNRNVMNDTWKKYFRIGWVSIWTDKPKLSKTIFSEFIISLIFIALWPLWVLLFIPYHISGKKEEKKLMEEYNQEQEKESLKERQK